uniref:Putative secreted protein n=1 Tax=Ixodes ricinus TaxID=34613 RepID=A0A6B0UJF6_IXORI
MLKSHFYLHIWGYFTFIASFVTPATLQNPFRQERQTHHLKQFSCCIIPVTHCKTSLYSRHHSLCSPRELFYGQSASLFLQMFCCRKNMKITFPPCEPFRDLSSTASVEML